MKHLAARERHVTASLIVHLAEMDKRRLYLAEGCSSLFTYCTQVLHLSEHAAYGRIEAAQAVGRFPALLEMLEEGSVTLTTVGLLAAHLTHENHRDLLAEGPAPGSRHIPAEVKRLEFHHVTPYAAVREAWASRAMPCAGLPPACLGSPADGKVHGEWPFSFVDHFGGPDPEESTWHLLPEGPKAASR